MQNNISPSAQPADGDPVDLWNWLQGGFAWESTPVPSAKVKQIIRTGRNTNTQPDAEIGNKPHPLWKVTPMTDGFELWCWPNPDFGIPWKGNKDPKYKIKLSYADPAQANYVRVFGPDDVATDNSKPKVYLGPGKTEHLIEAKEFFTETPFKTPKLDTAYRNLVAEGITYGTATIKMEVINIATGMPVGEAQEVRVTVNVDRIEQKPADVASNKDALHLRGFKPHHWGMRGKNQSTAGIRALRGKMKIRLPAADGSATKLTPMDSNELKKQSAMDQQDSGASFWIGLTEYNASGSVEQWVQTGVRWVQPTQERKGSAPALYLEAGDTYLNLGANRMTQETTNGGDARWLGGGVSENADDILANWHNQTIDLEFILFKTIGDTNNGIDTGMNPWKVLFKDAANHYILMTRSAPSASGTVGQAATSALDLRYRSQSFKDIDCLFETNNSAFFLPGKTDSHASFENLQFATTLIPFSASEPGTSNQAALFDWAKDNFSWEHTNLTITTKEAKSGKWNGNEAQNGSHTHPYWNLQAIPNKLEIWDNRNYGYK